jgi:hypothetical protein
MGTGLKPFSFQFLVEFPASCAVVVGQTIELLAGPKPTNIGLSTDFSINCVTSAGQTIEHFATFI